jgi:type VI secretion system FHA domain protein
MAIKLRVISDHYRELGEQRSRVFGVNGGTIGRSPDNDWVLPDAKRLVSGHHCEIEYRGGAYWLKDTSTNGVYVNDAAEPVSATGPLVLRDGDRLRIGDYDVIVSVDARIDFLPAASDEHSAAKHLDSGLGASLDLDSLLTPREVEDSGSMPIRNVYGQKFAVEPAVREDTGVPDRPHTPLSQPPDERGRSHLSTQPVRPVQTPPPPGPGTPEWAMKTRAMTRQELAEAVARRQSRLDARQQTVPFHQQATTWNDLRTALQAFCRGAGIELSGLSAEAQSMLPLVAGQLLREAVVGLSDLAQARARSLPAAGNGSSSGANPLRSSTSAEQALLRLFESHGRVYGGPVEALRDVLQDARDHEAALQAAVRSGLEAVLGQLAPANVADQYEQGRARALAPGQDPRPKYWEHYAEFYRVILQNVGPDGLPHPFKEAYAREYARVREELRAKRKGAEGSAG